MGCAKLSKVASVHYLGCRLKWSRRVLLHVLAFVRVQSAAPLLRSHLQPGPAMYLTCVTLKVGCGPTCLGQLPASCRRTPICFILQVYHEGRAAYRHQLQQRQQQDAYDPARYSTSPPLSPRPSWQQQRALAPPASPVQAGAPPPQQQAWREPAARTADARQNRDWDAPSEPGPRARRQVGSAQREREEPAEAPQTVPEVPAARPREATGGAEQHPRGAAPGSKTPQSAQSRASTPEADQNREPGGRRRLGSAEPDGRPQHYRGQPQAVVAPKPYATDQSLQARMLPILDFCQGSAAIAFEM